LEVSGPYGADAVIGVVDLSNMAPTADAGPDVMAECDGGGNATVSLDGSGSSDPEGATLTCLWTSSTCTIEAPESCVTQALCPMGGNLVSLVVHDGELGSTADEAAVTVLDTAPPQIHCPSEVVVECSAAGGADVELSPTTASDGCDQEPVITNDVTNGGADASGFYALGTTEVTFTATDGLGNASSCTTMVAVVDTAPPVITSTVPLSVLWPPNHRMVDVAVAVTATDACSTPAVVLASVTSNELDDAPGGGDGATSEDIQGTDVGTPDFTVQLRAERGGSGNGRTYALTYSASDGSGNAATETDFVFVPHDQRSGVEPVGVSLAQTEGGTTVSWDVVPGAILYSVVRGDVGNLRETDTSIDLGHVTCIQANAPATSTVGHEESDVPAIGKAFFYLVAYNDGWGSSGYGTTSVAKPRTVASRDCQ
jgi:hypothetical protein